MKILSPIGLSAAEVSTKVQSIRVCMHILRTARTDARVMREATALVEAGFAVSIVDVESDSTLPVEEEIQGISMKHIIMPSWDIPTRFKPWFVVKIVLMVIIGAVWQLRIQADIYHAHDEKAIAASYIAARLRRKPLIFDAPEMPLSDPTVTRWRWLCALSDRLLSQMMLYCARVITVSLPIAQEIGRHYHSSEVSLVRNVPAYRVVSKSDRLRYYLGLSPNIRIALYQGNIQADRGLDKLIRAATFLEPDTVIVIMGKGSDATLSELEVLIDKEGVSERVKIIPPVPYEELLDWTASADIGLTILPPDYSFSIKMCLPNKFFEYLMAGLPVLSSQLEIVADIIKTYDIGQVVSSLTPTAIAATINSMMADRVSLVRMHSNALNVAKEFCWEKESQVLLRIYYDILTK